ncbi:MAG: DsbA family protein [Nannocystaceae bacterium]
MRRQTVALGLALCVGLLGACNRNSQDHDHDHDHAAKQATFDDERRFQADLAPGDHTLGGAQPLVTVVVFGGYACPPCARTWQVLENVLEDYGDQVRVVFRSLTIPGLAREEQAVEAAFAAGAQGKFWPMHRRLMAARGKFDRKSLEGYAAEIGLDVEKFASELDTGVHTAARMRHRREGLELGVKFGPVAFVNGRPIVGHRDEPQWHGLVDQELANAHKMIEAGTPRGELYSAVMAEAIREPITLPKEALEAYEQLVGKPAEAEKPPLLKPESGKRYRVLAGDAPTLGPDDAPLLLVAFIDIECPYCKRVHTESLVKLRERYPKDLRIAVRHYPLVIHQAAEGLARAAVAAHRQEQFWPFYERLMAAKSGAVGRSTFVEIADELGMDRQRFLDDLDAEEVMEVVREDVRLGRRLGVDGTPGFFLNGRYFSGYQPLENMIEKIDEELADARKREQAGVSRADLLAESLVDAIPESSFPNASAY